MKSPRKRVTFVYLPHTGVAPITLVTFRLFHGSEIKCEGQCATWADFTYMVDPFSMLSDLSFILQAQIPPIKCLVPEVCVGQPPDLHGSGRVGNLSVPRSVLEEWVGVPPERAWLWN